MISVILIPGDSAVLARTLAALVPAAVDGLVKTVIVVPAQTDRAVLALVEDSGARLVSASGDRGARLAAGAAVASGDWILTLDPALDLPEDWRGPVEAHLAGGGGSPAWFGPPGLVDRLTGRALGVLVRRADYTAGGGFAPGDRPEKALIRALRARRIG